MKLSDDAISREAVIKDFTQWRGKMAYSVGEDYSGVSLLDRAIRVIKDMPPVTQKSGKRRNNMRDLSDISNEALANILRGMILTGITVSDCEREYLEEAAKRLENEERIILNDR